MAFETIIVDTRGKVGLITLNRPEGAECAEQAGAGRTSRALNAFEARCRHRRDRA
jgi:enoyl-CoA hydratase